MLVGGIDLQVAHELALQRPATQDGLITVGVVVAFLTYVQQFFRPIQALSSFYTTAQSSLAASPRALRPRRRKIGGRPA